MQRQNKITVTEHDEGRRLDVFLSLNQSQLSRMAWQKAVKNKQVLVNNNQSKNSYLLQAGDLVTYAIPAQKKQPQQTLNFPILYKDDDVIVINKPAGAVVYAPNKTSNSPSIVENLKKLISDTGDRAGVVHRLDRDTSGVMILAKTSQAKEFLKTQFAKRKVIKEYRVLVHGQMKPSQARVELPLARHPKKYSQMVVLESGKPAVLEYQSLKHYKDYDFLKINLLTGRTHQIRVQLSYLGHPVVGDSLYGKKDDDLSRQFVHAYSLTIKLPNDQTKTFQADLPPDLQNYLDNLS